MQHFRESDLDFYFPATWAVRSFDQTKAFKSLSGHGLMGVDFIALTDDGRILLLEVKNYRPRYKHDREYRATRRPPGELADRVLKKFRDSERLIRTVNAALRRRWWVRTWLRWLHFRRDVNNTYAFWAEAERRLADPAKRWYGLWMETPERNTDYDDAVARHLRRGLAEECSVFVTENERSADYPFGIGEDNSPHPLP